jgi:hypothetical protein
LLRQNDKTVLIIPLRNLTAALKGTIAIAPYAAPSRKKIRPRTFVIKGAIIARKLVQFLSWVRQKSSKQV